jgi:hypothetical protein
MPKVAARGVLDLLIEAVSLCVAESQDKVSQSLLSTLRAMTVNTSSDPEERERDRQTMRGLVLLIKERLEKINAIGATLCGCLAEVLLLQTLKDTTPFKTVKVVVGGEEVPADKCPVKVEDKEIEVPKWALEAFYMWMHGIKYSEICKRFGVSRQRAQYWVNRLRALNPQLWEKAKAPETQSTEPQPPTPSPDEAIWQLLKGKVKGQ